MYCVYEHWKNGKCYYVGKGSLSRAFSNNKRKNEWYEVFGKDIKKWNEMKNEVVRIVHNDIVDNKVAIELERERSFWRRMNGHPLTNVIDGQSLYPGKPREKEVIEKIKCTWKNKGEIKFSEEHKKKLSDAQKGRDRTSVKEKLGNKVICVENNMKFLSQREAARWHGTSINPIRKSIKTGEKTTKGYTFRITV